ncbi:MAG: ATP-dependent sacrificial sulfur transferase LarE [Longimicrobiales bacterium]|nr:ATP-dependent sacrificial sulfur transferase LarE [Longimicrobiales bacterium]
MSRIELPVLPDFPGHPAGLPRPGDRTAQDKLDELLDALRRYRAQGALIAFSGGVDSAFLVWAAAQVAEGEGRLVALTTVSPSTPGPDLEDASSFAASLGVDHLCVESHELDREEYARNDAERCYHCKSDLFVTARSVARERGLAWVLYGYTASDRHDVRPGHRAAEENGVRAPLADVGLEKAEIRALMRERNLELADKPASPCLSSRITTGLRVDRARLEDVAAMEAILRRQGIGACRARVCEAGGSVFFRIEVEPADMENVLACSQALQEEGRRRGYRWVTLDLGGYRTGGGSA